MTRVRGAWLDARSTQAVFAALEARGNRALAVGGCVRNALLGAPVADVDIATDAVPDRVVALVEAAGLKAVPTGIEHGTVTVVCDGVGIEVTTFRADIETDGRHARVRFATEVAEDAKRRDFTMNALYCDRQGILDDPLGGLADLRARRLRFIGSARNRIAEDYLRILRFFRFGAWYADPAHGMDPEALAAIADSLDGLAGLSRERVGGEILKLLAAPDPAPALAAMSAVGVLQRLLPGTDPTALAPLVHLETQAGAAPDPLRRLAALGSVAPDALRLSNAQARRLGRIGDAARHDDVPAALGYRLGAEEARDALLVRRSLLGQQWSETSMAEIRRGAEARFPVSSGDLMPAYRGPALGARLSQLEAAWIQSNFTLGREDLMALPPPGAA